MLKNFINSIKSSFNQITINIEKPKSSLCTKKLVYLNIIKLNQGNTEKDSSSKNNNFNDFKNDSKKSVFNHILNNSEQLNTVPEMKFSFQNSIRSDKLFSFDNLLNDSFQDVNNFNYGENEIFFEDFLNKENNITLKLNAIEDKTELQENKNVLLQKLKKYGIKLFDDSFAEDPKLVKFDERDKGLYIPFLENKNMIIIMK